MFAFAEFFTLIIDTARSGRALLGSPRVGLRCWSVDSAIRSPHELTPGRTAMLGPQGIGSGEAMLIAISTRSSCPAVIVGEKGEGGKPRNDRSLLPAVFQENLQKSDWGESQFSSRSLGRSGRRSQSFRRIGFPPGSFFTLLGRVRRKEGKACKCGQKKSWTPRLLDFRVTAAKRALLELLT